MIGKIIFCLFLGYIFGCFSTGRFISKIYKVDITRYGSGNSGTTNTLRTLGPIAAIGTLFGDMIKTIIPILIIKYFVFKDVEYIQLLVLYTGLGAVLGHNFPFWLRFKGGKGIATTAGAMVALDPWVIPFGLPLFILVVALTRYVSIGSLVAAIFFPVWILIRYPNDLHMLIVSLMFTILAFIKHRSNIRKLIDGTENKIGQKVKIDK